MELRNFVISVAIFSIVITALAIAMAQLGANYGIGVDEGWNDSYSKLEDISGEAELTRGQIAPGESSETSATAGDRLTGMIKGAWAVLMMPFRVMDLLFGSGGIIETFAMEYNLPIWLINSFLSIVAILLVFVIASAILRHNI